MRLLVIEDEAKVAHALKEGLEGEHYEVVVAKTGEDGFFHASAEMYDLIVLDVMLPGRDGIEVLTTLRTRGTHTPVLILAAKDTIEDRMLGLDSGADDYLVKPFAFPELLARIRALLRRRRIDQVLRFKAGDLELDVMNPRVSRNSHLLDLTARELGRTGLGLAIARWAVEAHSGRIELQSEEGTGRTFRVTLPSTQM